MLVEFEFIMFEIPSGNLTFPHDLPSTLGPPDICRFINLIVELKKYTYHQREIGVLFTNKIRIS